MTTATPARHRGETSHSGRSPLTGTGTMVRLMLRRDRIRLPAWVAGHGLLVVYIGSALPQLASSEEELAGMSTLLSQPVGRMFTGPAFGMEDVTYERFFVAGYAPYLFILSALMSLLLVTRHTRAEEQSGRAELVRASVAGRHTTLTAALGVAAIANLAAGGLVIALAVAVGYAVTGSVLVGAGTALTGMAFAGVSAVTAQLSEFSRSASAMAGGVLGASFLLRAMGDMVATGGSALSWFSPLAWPAQTAPYVLDRSWPLLLSVALAVVTVATAFALQRRRDFGAGLTPPRPGPAEARPALGHPFGLAARLQRGGILGWGFAILALGVTDGLFTQAMLDAGEDMPPELSAVFGSEELMLGYVGFLGTFISILVAAYVVYAMQTLRAEEGSGRAAAVLAGPVSRTGWLTSHVGTIALGAVLITALTGLGTGVAAAGVTGNSELVVDVLVAHLAALPAPLAVLGLCAGLFGWLPRAMAPVGWALVALTAVVDLFGEMLDLPEGVLALSPLWHLASVPVEDFEAVPFLVLLGAALVLYTVGVVGFRQRQVGVV